MSHRKKQIRAIGETWVALTQAFTQTLLEIQQAARAVTQMAGAVQEAAERFTQQHRPER